MQSKSSNTKKETKTSLVNSLNVVDVNTTTLPTAEDDVPHTGDNISNVEVSLPHTDWVRYRLNHIEQNINKIHVELEDLRHADSVLINRLEQNSKDLQEHVNSNTTVSKVATEQLADISEENRLLGNRVNQLDDELQEKIDRQQLSEAQKRLTETNQELRAEIRKLHTEVKALKASEVKMAEHKLSTKVTLTVPPKKSTTKKKPVQNQLLTFLHQGQQYQLWETVNGELRVQATYGEEFTVMTLRGPPCRCVRLYGRVTTRTGEQLWFGYLNHFKWVGHHRVKEEGFAVYQM